MLKPRIGKRSLALKAAGAYYGNATRKAVSNRDSADRDARDAATIHADLERATPSPTMVVATTAKQFAVPHQGRSAEVVVYLEFLIGRRKCRADENSASRTDVSKATVLDSVARPAVDRSAICEECQLARASADDIATRRRPVPHKALV